MSSPFIISGLKQDQIDSEITLTYIDKLDDKVDALTTDVDSTIDELFHLDLNPQFNTIVPNLNNTYDAAGDNITIYGQENNTASGKLVIVGNNNHTETQSDTNIIVGHNSDQLFSVNNICIGHDTDITGYGIGQIANNNIVVGNNSDILGDSNENIVIAHDSDNGGVVNNLTQIGSINNNGGANLPVSGSVIFSCNTGVAGHPPSALPRLQFLSSHILNPQGAVFGDALDTGTTFPVPNIHGYIRIKYGEGNYLLPVIIDPNDANTSPPPVL